MICSIGFAWTALLGLAQALYLNSELSFGHADKISPDLREIPNWHIQGDNSEILSTKLVLTPPAPGHQRSSIWSQKPLLYNEWTADVDFRATGPERAGGNLQIWYAASGQDQIGSASVYTVGRFDGLVILIDQYAGSGGFIRGFLNDGLTDYANHHSVDSLAFGHCEYSYRNLGRPSRIAIQQTTQKFSVSVDGRLCFSSDKIKLPLGYSFGLSSASAENPDSFEIFKFVVTTESQTPEILDTNADPHASFHEYTGVNQHDIENHAKPGDMPTFTFNDPPEAPASEFKNNDAQFADLHNRLQAMMRHISALSQEIQSSRSFTTHSQDGVQAAFARLEDTMSKLDFIPEFEKKLDAVQADVRQTKADLHNALDRHVAGLKNDVRVNHANVLGGIAEHKTGIAGFLFVVFGSQAVLVGAYLWYKRRKVNGPYKKFL
ncbi:concanavalin A-like lectin/glucanase domain-containing protein [Calycina marina]|uniref:Concanavalin A-like lectin/glucanase domain-containing protein n=1 Tax=Calycina marina TaxID=1763456 RepID=A0A9P7Z8T4_9HELO|nr:concanavalin A-like lectin/glucanase domain-containing protein [Calycina marina]